MEFEIKEKREYKDEASGKSFANYKFFFAGKTYWIGQKAFEKNAKLLKIEENKIVLEEPLEEFYELKIRKNEKGEFKTILPKTEIEAEKSIAKEPEVAYETKAKKLKKPVKKTRKQKIEDFFNLPLPKIVDKKESISKTETSLKEPKQPEKPKEQSRQAFISSLIPHIKTADDKLKNRYFDLLSKEMEGLPQMEERIMRELGEIKEKVELKKSENIKERVSSSTPPNPKDTTTFLTLFKDSKELKFLTHEFKDDKPEYKTYIESCKREFDKALVDYPNVKDTIKRRVEEFAFSTEPKWYIRKPNNEKYYPGYGWSENSFIEWYKKTQTKHPWLDSKWKKKMILPFQNSIEMKEGKFFGFVEKCLIDVFGKEIEMFEIEYNEYSLKSAEFYTDVDVLGEAFRRILRTIKDKAEERFKFELKIEYDKDNQARNKCNKIIKIIHCDSECLKKSNDPDFLKGDLREIRNLLWGLCNYDIEAKFNDGEKRKVIISDDKKEIEKIFDVNTNDTLGFTHILKFY